MRTELVGLSFDDGPSRWTEGILDLLAQHGARATFFLVGSTAQEHPDIVRRIRRGGHEIGNHTWSHPMLARDCNDERVRDELVRANDCLERIAGVRPTLFRAPHHDHDERVDAVAAALGLRHARSDVAPPDWHPRFTAGLIASMALREIVPGAIVALHDGAPPAELADGTTREHTVGAVAEVLPALARRGLSCVTVSEAIGG